MTHRADIERVLEENRYLVLATSDQDGAPWATPVFFAPFGSDRLLWVSSPDSRHSRNIAQRAAVAITVFDSTVEVGHAEAVYFDADAARAPEAETDAALSALNARVPPDKLLNTLDLHPHGPLVIYRATIRHRYLLVRGGNTEFKNVVDMTLRV